MIKEYGSNFELSYTPGRGNGCDLNNDKSHLFLRSARECLYVIGKEASKKSIKTVFVPALCCRSMVQPFRQLNFHVEYYRLKQDLSFDMDYLVSILKDNALLVVMKYHGMKTYDINQLRTVTNRFNNICLIQDCTQHIFTESLYDTDVDYHIGSLRKWVAIPDGAFLSGSLSDSLRNDVVTTEEDPFVIEALKGMIEKTEYLSSGRPELKTSYRQRNVFCMEYLKGTIVPHCMSKTSKAIIRNDLDIGAIKKQRHENYVTLYNALKVSHGEILQFATNQSCPLCLPIIIEKRDVAQRTLAESKVFCQVLWPIPENANQICDFSVWFSNHMLAVPCDQRYTTNDMEYIAEAIENVIDEKVR
jgi:hypothetical protein